MTQRGQTWILAWLGRHELWPACCRGVVSKIVDDIDLLRPSFLGCCANSSARSAQLISWVAQDAPKDRGSPRNTLLVRQPEGPTGWLKMRSSIGTSTDHIDGEAAGKDQLVWPYKASGIGPSGPSQASGATRQARSPEGELSGRASGSVNRPSDPTCTLGMDRFTSGRPVRGQQASPGWP